MNCVHSAGNTNQSDTNSSKFFSPALQEYTKTLIKTAKQPDTELSTLINSIENDQPLDNFSTCRKPVDESIIISSDTSDDDDDNNNSKKPTPITTTTTATSTIKVQNSKEKLPQQKVLEQKISKLEVITSNKSNASVNCNSMREKQHKRQTDNHVTRNEGERNEGGGDNVNKINKPTPKNVKKKVFNLNSQQKLTSFFTPVKK